MNPYGGMCHQIIWYRPKSMGTLRNPRYERFAQELANGTNQAFAYMAAGYRTNAKAAAVSANRLLNRSEGKAIRERVAEILAEREEIHQRTLARTIEQTAVDKSWVLARLIENANNCAVIGDDGKPLAASAANRALELIGKEIGMFVDKSEVTVNDNADVTDMSREELAAEAERIARGLRLKTVGGRDLGDG